MNQVISMIANRTSVKFYALVLGAALALTPVQALATNNDIDVDSVNDKIDNCIPESGGEIDRLAAQNPRVRGVQPDTDDDGFGNRCDFDYDNNGIVGFSDFGILIKVGGAVDQERHPLEETTMVWDTVIDVDGMLVTPEVADYNADGRVNKEDLDALLLGWGDPPGPSNAAQ